VEVEVRMKWSWSWSGVVENACGGGVEIEGEISNLGTLILTEPLKVRRHSISTHRKGGGIIDSYANVC
jgi:hypothetical protein